MRCSKLSRQCVAMVESGSGGSLHHDRGQAVLGIVDRATEMALFYFHDRGRLRTTSKKAKMDLVTEADQEIERFIKGELARLAPADGFLGEETGGGTGEALWVVDPLDGTANFLSGLPFWAVSIGFVEAGSPVVGAISVPVLQETFHAVRGNGALCNGVPIRVSAVNSLERSRVIFGRSTDLPPETALRFAGRAMSGGALIYSFGSCAFNLTRIANGSCDYYYEERVFPWDAAAGAALIREAGGDVDYEFVPLPWRMEARLLQPMAV